MAENKLRKILSGLLVMGATVIPVTAHTYPETSPEYQLLKNVSTDVVRTGRELLENKIRLFEKIYASVTDTLRVVVIDGDNNGSPSEGDRIVFEESSEQPPNYDFSRSIVAPPNKHPSYRLESGKVEVVPSVIHGLILNTAITVGDDEIVKRLIRGIERETTRDSYSLLTRVGALYENDRK